MSTLTGKTILIVDDEKDLREAIAYEFEMIGCNVLQANSGNEAMKIILGNSKVDIVLSDVRMPNGDGVDLLTKIRQMHPTIPIVAMVTGFTDYPEAELKKIGALDVFRKPIKIELVLRVLEAAFAAA